MKTNICTNPKPIINLIATISDQSLLNEHKWRMLEQEINQCHNNFTIKLRWNYPVLSEDDIHIILLLRMGMSHAQIAGLTHVLMSSFRIRRSRLKKKMNVQCSSISDFIKNLYR